MFALKGVIVPICISFLTDTVDQGPEQQIDVAAVIGGFANETDRDLGCDV